MASNQAEQIRENIARIRAEICAAAAKVGRSGSEITFLAATKTRTVEEIRVAIDAGIDAAGENRAQELRDKLVLNAYGDCPVHLIGPLQTNKVKYAVGKTAMIHSLDSKKLAEAISLQAAKLDTLCNVLIEINIGNEAAKAGIAPAEAAEFAASVCELPNLSLRGLMAIPPAGEDARRYFAQMKDLFESLKRDLPASFDTLSMGMSHDYAVAIEEGATIVRVGTAIFGARVYPQTTGSEQA
ncbi:MAG: YggS family pyridoxal phosphate-dependent enzyme [Clostridia bacterium]|nr:YggS family pyridoxal phosphate-dependent enzyme [Clostridia bacterium]